MKQQTKYSMVIFLLIIAVLGMGQHYQTQTINQDACLNYEVKEVKNTCSVWEDGQCQVWKETEQKVCTNWVGDNYNHSGLEKAQSVELPEDGEQLYSPVPEEDRSEEGIPLQSASPGTVCLEAKNGRCTLKEEDGKLYAYVGEDLSSADPTRQQLGIFDSIGGWFGGDNSEESEDDDSGVDVGVGDDTTVEYPDGSEETYDSGDDTDGDGYVEVGDSDEGSDSDSGTDSDPEFNDGDDSDTSGGSSGGDDDQEECAWWDVLCDGNSVENTERMCTGEKYSNGEITGYEKVVEKKTYEDGSTETETLTNCIQQNTYKPGEPVEVCRSQVDGEDVEAGCFQYEHDIQAVGFLGGIGLLN